MEAIYCSLKHSAKQDNLYCVTQCLKKIMMTKPSSTKNATITGDNKKESQFKTKVFSKSGYPATAKDTFKLILNLFVNLFS